MADTDKENLLNKKEQFPNMPEYNPSLYTTQLYDQPTQNYHPQPGVYTESTFVGQDNPAPSAPPIDNIPNNSQSGVYDTRYFGSHPHYNQNNNVQPVPTVLTVPTVSTDPSVKKSKKSKKSNSILGKSINDDACHYVEFGHRYSSDDWREYMGSRHKFIRKIMMILGIQLLFTFGVVALFSFVDPVREFVQTNTWMVWPALGGSLLFLLIFACCDKIVRLSPLNYFILGGFTLVESYLIGLVASAYSPESVISAVIMTVIVTLGLMIFACQTKYDFTGFGPYLMGGLLVLILWGIINAVLCANFECKFMETVYALAGAFIFSMYIIYDTQLIVGGKHRKYQFSEDDHVFAALALYLDIINLFLYILQLFGNKRDE